jgi:hypothetical protein
MGGMEPFPKPDEKERRHPEWRRQRKGIRGIMHIIAHLSGKRKGFFKEISLKTQYGV